MDSAFSICSIVIFYSFVKGTAAFLTGFVSQETGFAACLFLFVLNFGHLWQKRLTIFTRNATLKVE